MTQARTIEHLVERQARLWGERQSIAKMGGQAAREALLHLTEGPWITISKQIGTGAAEVARRLAERLKWQVFDREILSIIAEETHRTESALKNVDEHAIGRLREILAHFMLSEVSGQTAYVREMTRVIWTLARQGKSIILGRGANWFLDQRFGLRMRLVAPVETRISCVAHSDRVGRAEAERRVRDADAEVAAFIHQAFRRDVDDPLGYDLIVNTAAVDTATIVDSAIAALRGKLGGQS